jgi:hypothetical protein
LPRAVGRREDFADPHALDASPKRLPVDAVAIAEEIGRRGVVWEGGRSRRRWDARSR